MRGIEGKVALVTGAAQGIGKKICELLLNEGAIVYGGDIKEEELLKTQKEFGEKNLKFNTIVLNVSDSKSCESCINTIVEREGRIDFLVNNAGVTRDTLLIRMKEEDWDIVLDVNLKGAFLLTKVAAKEIKPPCWLSPLFIAPIACSRTP